MGKEARGTEYLILKSVRAIPAASPADVIEGRGALDIQLVYEIVGRVTATAAKTAARSLVPDPEEGAEYVAIPTGNWTALRPKVRQRDPIVEWEETTARPARARPAAAEGGTGS